LRSRPRAAENDAIALLIRLCREFHAAVHIVHLSSSDAIPCLQRARADGVKITVETCPHYLSFTAEEIPDGATEFKCAPPIRDRENCEQLWSALKQGTVDLVATDHSPCPPDMKCRSTGDFMRAWGGISSLQLSLPVMWTQAIKRGIKVPQVSRWLCEAPARLARLDRKGAIAVGNDADLVVWDPEARFTVEPNALHHRHKLTPYAGQSLQGVVRSTFLRGQKIYEDGQLLGMASGHVLKRNAS
jgi:allantoinase